MITGKGFSNRTGHVVSIVYGFKDHGVERGYFFEAYDEEVGTYIEERVSISLHELNLLKWKYNFEKPEN